MYAIIDERHRYYLEEDDGSFCFVKDVDCATTFEDEESAECCLNYIRSQTNKALDIVKVLGISQWEWNSYIYDNCGYTPNDPEFNPDDF